MSGIFTLAPHSARMFPIFVIRANIDIDDKEKTQNLDFWSKTISVKDVIIIVHTQHTKNLTEKIEKILKHIKILFYMRCYYIINMFKCNCELKIPKFKNNNKKKNNMETNISFHQNSCILFFVL